jgi:ATP-dependent Clp protease ATP-binding subunit ClpA
MELGDYRTGQPLIDAAIAEAGALGHPFVGAEHLLLAVLGSPTDGAKRVLAARHGLELAAARATVARLLGRPAIRAAGLSLPLSERARVAISRANEAGQSHGAAALAFTAEDLLAALLRDEVADGLVGAVLAEAGLTPATARAELGRLTGNDAAT